MVTRSYSTSFSLGIRMFNSEFRAPIYGIYGFVRLADEIVDTFHHMPKQELLNEFRKDTFEALERRFSLNPVLQSFQEVVYLYQIDHDLISAFLDSMEMDLTMTRFTEEEYKKYIHGSAEVVGLMCLKVFLGGDEKEYQRLKPSAMALGSAFQKVNFLRDFKSDFFERGRVYFPGVDYEQFNEETKQKLVDDIRADFDAALKGIVELPNGVRSGVKTAYRYYKKLLNKIERSSFKKVQEERIRVSDFSKIRMFLATYITRTCNMG